jgi:hypothetical protein
MPPFRRKLTEAQARDLVAYLREVGGIASKMGKTAPKDFARQFQELRKELEELQRQFRKLAPNPSQPERKQ